MLERLLPLLHPSLGHLGLDDSPPGWSSPLREYPLPDFDIWYIAAGSGAGRFDGEWLALEAGDLLTLPRGTVYEGARAHRVTGMRTYYVHFHPFGRPEPDLDAALSGACPRLLRFPGNRELPVLFGDLLKARAAGGATWEPACRGLVLQILAVVLGEVLSGGARDFSAPHRGALQAREFIDSHYRRDLTVRDIADRAGLSPGHLSAVFRSQYGVPPIEYLLQVRIREARKLLAEGLSVKQTAHEVGFHSQHYFSRAFRQRTGAPPVHFSSRGQGDLV